jgi:L-cysteine:1D-myo-inositol 2-amino-2-deoxy-alpha-D-glucopyranoside ligase
MSAVQAVSLTGRRPFAQVYVHQAMVGLDGEKMSKSQGNLVLVSALRERGVDPMAIRLVLLGQHYRTAWSYREGLLEEAGSRLARWRSVGERVDATVGPDALDEGTVSAMRLALADDLNSPEAVRVVDDWMQSWQESSSPRTAPSPLVPRAVEALLGIPLLPATDQDPAATSATP